MRTLKTTVRAGNLFGNPWESWKALEQCHETIRCAHYGCIWWGMEEDGDEETKGREAGEDVMAAWERGQVPESLLWEI